MTKQSKMTTKNNETITKKQFLKALDHLYNNWYGDYEMMKRNFLNEKLWSVATDDN